MWGTRSIHHGHEQPPSHRYRGSRSATTRPFSKPFDKLFAKCQNALRGRWENFWATEQTSVVRLVDPSAVVDKMTYALTNPVKDDLVEKARDWPGVTLARCAAPSLGRSPLPDPSTSSARTGPMPEVVSLVVRPAARLRGTFRATEFAAMILERVRAAEEAAAAERRRTGSCVLGRKRRSRSKMERPRRSPASHDANLNPRVAARSKWSRIEASAAESRLPRRLRRRPRELRRRHPRRQSSPPGPTGSAASRAPFALPGPNRPDLPRSSRIAISGSV